MNHDKVAMSMLAMAETLRTQHPPKLKMAIKCARGSLKLQVAKETEAHCRLQLGKLLYFYTEHFDMARNELKTAYEMFTTMGDFHTDKKFEALCLLAELYIHCKKYPLNEVCNYIRIEFPKTPANSTVYNKIMFYYIEANQIDNNMRVAIETCQLAANTCRNTAMELYYLITKQMLAYQISFDEPDAREVAKIAALLKELETTSNMGFHFRSIKGYYMCMKMAAMLTQGKSRTARVLLRQVQAFVQEPVVDQQPGIRWMDTTAMTVLACVFNVASSLVQCSFDRVNKYHHTAVKHADDIITKSTRYCPEYSILRSVTHMKMVSLELMALCNVMVCRPDHSLTNIATMLNFGVLMGGNELNQEYAPRMQYILALLSCYVRKYDEAERHFHAAINMVPNTPGNESILALLRVNLAMCYLNQMKMAEYYDVAENLTAQKIVNCSPMVRYNVQFLNAYYCYLNQKTADSKTLLTELLQVAKTEDFFRLHGLALLLRSLMIPVDEVNVKPTIDWIKKSFDHVLMVWSYTYYSQLLHARGVDVKEFLEAIQRSLSALDTERLISISQSDPNCTLMNWYFGDPLEERYDEQ